MPNSAAAALTGQLDAVKRQQATLEVDVKALRAREEAASQHLHRAQSDLIESLQGAALQHAAGEVRTLSAARASTSKDPLAEQAW
jgi:predicted  nucleic acid-binding Zn-ribbon protein